MTVCPDQCPQKNQDLLITLHDGERYCAPVVANVCCTTALIESEVGVSFDGNISTYFTEPAPDSPPLHAHQFVHPPDDCMIEDDGGSPAVLRPTPGVHNPGGGQALPGSDGSVCTSGLMPSLSELWVAPQPDGARYMCDSTPETLFGSREALLSEYDPNV